MKNILISFSFVLLMLASCKDAQWVMKQTDKNVKYAYAQKFYQKGKFIDAVPVIEDLLSYYKGNDTAEQLYFMLAETYYQNKEYMIAAYHYRTFRDLYPRSYKTEVASFKIADCYKREIPRIDLEQTDTEKAIEYYNRFIAEYPKSAMVEVAYEHIKELRRILELKALEAANLYYKTGNYRAAAVTYKNVVTQYPNIREYEDLMYKSSMSYFKFAEKSIITKQTDRYEKALNEGQNFVNRYPESKYVNEIKEMVETSKVKILEAALKNANSYYVLTERPLYYNQSIGLFDEFSPEIKKLPSSLMNYKDKCYIGILRTYFYILEDSKDVAVRTENYKYFMDSYYGFITKFKSRSEELYEAEELFKKVNQFYKS